MSWKNSVSRASIHLLSKFCNHDKFNPFISVAIRSSIIFPFSLFKILLTSKQKHKNAPLLIVDEGIAFYCIFWLITLSLYLFSCSLVASFLISPWALHTHTFIYYLSNKSYSLCRQSTPAMLCRCFIWTGLAKIFESYLIHVRTQLFI